jgi:hypothetical protein
VWPRVVRPRLHALVVETLTRAAPALRRVGNGFEWLGVDVLLEAGEAGEDLRPWLLEVNVSPDVSHSTPVTTALAGAATRDLLRLLLDDEARAPHWGPWGDLSAVKPGDLPAWRLSPELRGEGEGDGKEGAGFGDECEGGCWRLWHHG